MARWLCAAFLGCAALLGQPQAKAVECFQNLPLGSPVPDVELPAANGGSGRLLGLPRQHKASVFLFFRPGQANSRAVLEELGRMVPAFAGKPVHWCAVVSSNQPMAQAQEDFAEAKLAIPLLVDKDEALAARIGVVLHPVIGVADGEGKLAMYHPYRAVSYGVRLRAMLQFLLGEIPKQELDAVTDPAPPMYGGGSAKALRHLRLAERLYEGKRAATALAELEKCIKLDPDLAAAHALLAEIIAAEKGCAAAKVPLELALKLDPANPRALGIRNRCQGN